MPGRLFEGKVLVLDEADGSRLYNRGYFGNPLPGGGVELDLVEAAYLSETGKLDITKAGRKLGQMAEVAHVSRRTIQMYLDGMSATVEAASRLEEFLNEPLVLPLDPFGLHEEEGRTTRASPAKEFHGVIRELLTKLGYDVFLTKRSPFDAITKDEAILFLTGMDKQERTLRRKAEVVANLSKVVEREPVMFVARREKVSLRGVPLIDARELRKLRERGEMVELVEERRE